MLPGKCARITQPWSARLLCSGRNGSVLLFVRQRLVVFLRRRRQARPATQLCRRFWISGFGPAPPTLLIASQVPHPVTAPAALDHFFKAFSRGAAPFAEAAPVRCRWARNLRRRSRLRTRSRFSIHILSLDAKATLDWRPLRDHPYCVGPGAEIQPKLGRFPVPSVSKADSVAPQATTDRLCSHFRLNGPPAPPQGLSGSAMVRLRRDPGVSPMLIRSTWETHRSITGPTPVSRRCPRPGWGSIGRPPFLVAAARLSPLHGAYLVPAAGPPANYSAPKAF